MSILFCCFLFLLPNVKGQDFSDYSEKELSAVVDTAKVGTEHYFEASLELLNRIKHKENRAGSESLAEEIINRAKEFKRPFYQAEALYSRHQIVQKESNYDQSFAFLKEAIAIAKREKLHSTAGKSLGQLGLVNFYADKYDAAISVLEETISFSKKHKLTSRLAATYYYLGYVYLNIYQKKIKETEKPSQEYIEYLEKSEYYFDEAMKTAESINHEVLINTILIEQSALFLQQKKFTQVIEINKELLKTDNSHFKYLLYHRLALANYGLNKIPLAENYLDTAILLVTKEGVNDEVIDFYELKYQWANEKKDYKTALDYHQKWNSLKESLWTKEKKIAFDELSISYETKKKEQENLLLAKDKEVLEVRNKWISLAALFFLFSLGVLTFYYYQNRTQNRLILQQKEELEKMDEMKSRFFTNVSHELRTPITLILNPLNRLLQSKGLNKEELTQAIIAKKNSEKLRQLVNEILSLTKIDAATLTLNEEPVAFFPFLRRVISMFESYAEQHDILFLFDYQANENLQLKFDASKVETILQNLLSNAIKFTSKGGTLTITVIDKGDRLQINVKDTGRGIRKQDMPFIFDRYFQTKRTDLSEEGGMGIGLALSKELAEFIKGNLSCTSTLGEGSNFCLEFPRLEIMRSMPTSDHQAIKKEITSNLTFNKSSELISIDKDLPTILLAEDNHDFQIYLSTFLKDSYNIIITDNGQEALERLQKKGTKLPDLIISDVMMLVMDGYQLLEQLKASEELRNIPIILLTAKAGLEDKLRALRIGVDDYLIKPFDESELLARMDNLLSNAFSRKDIAESMNEEEPITNLEDQAFLDNLHKAVSSQMVDTNFTISDLLPVLFISQSKLYYEVKRLTGMTPNQYIQEIRFNTARRLLENKQVKTVKEVVYAIGFKDAKFFSAQFKKRFGKSPSKYL